jgi:3-oxoacyl-[acyl-carrier-protein] synthase III
MGIRIIGTGSYAPLKVLTNHDLEKIVDTSDEWITSRTGIKERHIAAEGEVTSDLALEAAKNALDAAGIGPNDLDGIIVASFTADKLLPSTSCILQHKLGVTNKCLAFDMQAACSGLLYAITVADSMLNFNPSIKRILIVGAEKMSKLIDWEDRATCVLFGDGAGAIILESTDATDEDCMVASNLGSDGAYSKILQIPAGGTDMPITKEVLDQRLQYVKMEGQEVFKLAVGNMVSSCKRAMEDAGVTIEQVKWLVPHQANYRILKAVATRLKMPEERVYMNVDRFGNTSAASIGLCLDEMARGKMVDRGDYVLLTAFGGGLTWGAVLLRW